MAWMLIYIMIQGNDVYAVNAYGPGYTFPEMYECFYAREMLSYDAGGQEGHFPLNVQAICMQVETEE